MFVLSWFKPAGQVGQSTILADRDTGAVFVLVDGRLHPAVNLVSARLIAGQASNPTFVKANELAKYPQGPSVGIAGAPTAMPLRTGDSSEWTVCDTARPTSRTPRPSSPRSADRSRSGRAPLPLDASESGARRARRQDLRHLERSAVARSTCRTRRSRWRSASTPDAPQPVKISTPLFDALPATEPLNTPAIPGAGRAVAVQRGAGCRHRIGAVGARPADRRRQVLRAAAQRRPAHLTVRRVAAAVRQLLRRRAARGGGAGPAGQRARRRSPPVDYYPTTRLELVDTASNPVTCLNWSKGSTDRASENRRAVRQGAAHPDRVGQPAAATGQERPDTREHRGRPGIYVCRVRPTW